MNELAASPRLRTSRSGEHHDASPRGVPQRAWRARDHSLWGKDVNIRMGTFLLCIRRLELCGEVVSIDLAVLEEILQFLTRKVCEIIIHMPRIGFAMFFLSEIAA